MKKQRVKELLLVLLLIGIGASPMAMGSAGTLNSHQQHDSGVAHGGNHGNDKGTEESKNRCNHGGGQLEGLRILRVGKPGQQPGVT